MPHPGMEMGVVGADGLLFLTFSGTALRSLALKMNV